ncbi:hypothetical protein ABEF95_001271 [Exophiala dermatitidis]
MASNTVPTNTLSPTADQPNNVSWDGNRFSVHVDSMSFELGTLPLFPWNEHSEVVVRIEPYFDSPDTHLPHMTDFRRADFYMRLLVGRAKRVAEEFRPLLRDRINEGHVQVYLDFGEC